MLFDPKNVKNPSRKISIKVFERLKKIKQTLFLNKNKK